MEDDINHVMPPYVNTQDEGGDCGVDEKSFPNLGKCCSRSNTTTGIAYQKICPNCSIWTSLPDSASLEVTTILECQSYGYGKRIKI